jgi:DNA polymerase I-like protein with 3'-5' exonuclease and polymerase domains
VLRAACSEEAVGFDIELEGLHPTAKIAGFSLYLPSRDEGYYVPLNHTEHSTSDVIVREYAKQLSLLPLVTYNGSFDLGRMEFVYGTRLNAVGDGDLVSKMFQLHKFGLKQLALELGIVSETLSLEDVLGRSEYDFTQAPLDDRTLDYTVQDAYLALKVERKLLEQNLKLDKYPDFHRVYKLECQVMPILGMAELQGMPLDRAKFSTTVRYMQMEADDLFQEICEALNRDPQTFNLASGARLSAALFNKPDRIPEPLPPMKPRQRKPPVQDDRDLPGLGLIPVVTATKPGKFERHSVAKNELERISDQHPVIEKIIRWVGLNAVLTRDIPHVDDWVKNGRVYPSFLQIGEDGTSRIYTGKPNIISMSYTVRDAMPPSPGKVYCHVDFKAAEWRIAALLAGEQDILDALDSGTDPHRLTYHKMTRKPLDQITKSERDTGKILNYAALFGSEGFSLARALKFTDDEISQAYELQTQFWQAYPKLAAWRDYRHQYAREHFRTTTILGRVRQLPGMHSKRVGIIKNELRRSVNTATQGSCGDLLKEAMVRFDEKARDPNSLLHCLGARIVIPVYDALLLEMDECALNDPRTKELVEKELKATIGVPMEYEGRTTRMQIDMGWSRQSWKEAAGK